MECICTECGNVWKSEELVFDITEAIREELSFLIEHTADRKERQNLLSISKVFFNIWKTENPFFFSEQELWRQPEITRENAADTDKYVSLLFPYDAVLKKIGETGGAEQDTSGTFEAAKELLEQWFEKEEHLIKNSMIELWLKKTGHGKIRFNQVFSKTTYKIITKKRQCPCCKHDMSFWAGRYKELRLTVLGGPRVSKSTTLTACADAFLKGYQDIVWEGHGEDFAWKQFCENYLKLYREGKNLKATSTEKERIPKLTFLVTIGGKKRFCLTFIDLAGELNGPNGVQESLYKDYKNFYDNIDFVWYCTDPGEIRQLEGSAESEKEIKELGYSEEQTIIPTDKIINNMVSLASFFERSNRKIPVAYILGKTDSRIIDDLDKEKYHLYDPEDSQQFIPFDVKGFWTESRKVRSYIETYNPRLLNNFENHFTARCYIAVSAYGYSPKDDAGQNQIPRPYHCTLPFLWMMALCNCIDIRVTVKKRRFVHNIQESVITTLDELPTDDRKKALENLYSYGAFKI